MSLQDRSAAHSGQQKRRADASRAERLYLFPRQHRGAPRLHDLSRTSALLLPTLGAIDPLR